LWTWIEGERARWGEEGILGGDIDELQFDCGEDMKDSQCSEIQEDGGLR
jgi:hypothetical protein